ncbi:MAG: response regulator, partial [Candidatus Cloacimonetes bacterium]|nr:response regulator [Candidatus Cloacimonadota bacterium]
MERSKILIIDDEPDIRDLYRSFLEGEEYDIYEAEDGQEAFKLAEQEKFDLYVTDILMPEMNGVEFMKVLKMIDPDAVVIIITGYDDMQYTRQALEYGAFRFLTKPINMREFRSVVELGLLERKKLFKSTTTDKLKRLKEKLNANPELHEKVFVKLEEFLIQMEAMGAAYIEIGGPGGKGKVWAKIRGKFVPIKTDRMFNQDEINIMLLTTLTNVELKNLLDSKELNFNFEFQREDIKRRFRVFSYFDAGELVVGYKPTRRVIISTNKVRVTKEIYPYLSMKNETSGLIIFSGP